MITNGKHITKGIVRFWVEEEGWGVIDSTQTPGGCWAGFADIEGPGYRSLNSEEIVELEWASGGQDGYPYRAMKVLRTAPR